MEQRDMHLKIINEVFENRLESTKNALLMPFISGAAFDQAEMDKLKETIYPHIVDSGNTFEQMVEMAIFMAEGTLMKALMGFLKGAANQWNKENDQSNQRHLYYDVDVKIREKSTEESVVS